LLEGEDNLLEVERHFRFTISDFGVGGDYT
jgi:hypothetical protein